MSSALLLVCLLACGIDAQQLFKNPDFEDQDLSASWGGNVWGYQLDVVNDPANAQSGQKYIKAHSRTQYWQGPGQNVDLKLNTNYNISCYFKILNNDTKMYQQIGFSVSYQWTSDYLQGDPQAKKRAYYDLAQRHMLEPTTDWVRLQGDFTTPSKAWHQANIYIQGPDPGIDFLIDDASLMVVPNDVNWKAEANKRIEQIRKSNVTLSVAAAPDMDPHHIEVEVNLKKHLFGFGSVVNDNYLLSTHYPQYQSLFYNFFNWATVGTLKWGYNQGTVENPNYNNTLRVIDELRNHGMHVRGHNMFWGVGSNDPAKVRQMNATELKQTIETRIQYMTQLTRGKLEHWDINNELLHGQVYEEITDDKQYSEKIYNMVHTADPYPKLFLNEYDVLSVGANTEQYLEQALEFKRNSHLDALGLQGHMRAFTEPNPTLMKHRLDTLARSGLPLWVTELTLSNADENQRADWYENVYRLLFSHPAVDGVVLWGFWDLGGYTSVDDVMVNGNNFYVNAAGKRYLDLIKLEWSTRVNFTIDGQNSGVHFRAFQGDYEVIIRYRGKAIKVDHFSVGKTATNHQISVMDGAEVALPSTMAPLTAPIHTHHVDHDGYRSLGQDRSLSRTLFMECNTRYSGDSEIGDDKTITAVCFNDEVLTSCSMITNDHRYFRDGEHYVMENGKMACQAVNAWRSTTGVQAVARCCKFYNLTCQYAMAGPSGSQPDDQIEVVCPSNTFATGCTSYTYFGQMDGAYSTLRSCVAQTAGDKGTFSYAACCSHSHLACNVKVSAESDLKQGSMSNVTCDNNWKMFGCSVYTEDGNTAGAYIRGNYSLKGGLNSGAFLTLITPPPDDENGVDTCFAVNGQDKFPGEMGVKAYATCCAIQ